ncbi:MAG: hypothetical protein C4589_04250 [Peptococcaceae bacterium]|nr:MAG: hypothetical protein C4589_04250 [Peptococcaceae bacterium]
MTTVDDVNKAFADKGMEITLPLEGGVVVTKIEVLERVKTPGRIKILLRVGFLNDEGREAQEIFLCEGSLKKERKPAAPVMEPPKKNLLPVRQRMDFDSCKGVLAYLQQAFSHLLEDKGYVPALREGADLYLEREGKGFFVNCAVRLDDAAFEQAKALVELRRSLRSRGAANDFALVVPAIQEPLGIPLRFQERWVARHQEYLSVQRVGVYGVNNQDPNKIYPFTVYPSAIELKRYFMITSQQWSLVRSRYVLERARREDD